jgi:hypothetical protein
MDTNAAGSSRTGASDEMIAALPIFRESDLCSAEITTRPSASCGACSLASSRRRRG